MGRAAAQGPAAAHPFRLLGAGPGDHDRHHPCPRGAGLPARAHHRRRSGRARRPGGRVSLRPVRSLREVVEAIYDAANRRDLDEMLELLHSVVVWWAPTSRLRGHAAVRGFLAGWQVSFRPQFTPERFIDLEDALAVMVRV